MIEKLNELDRSGLMKDLTKVGFMPIKVKKYLDIYNDYNRRIGVNGQRSTEAVIELSIIYKTSEQTIWKAIKTIKSAC